MRKKKLLVVSLLLVILQIVSLFAMIPTAAATQGRSYTIYKANVAPTADGGVTQGEDWDNVPWSENFVHTGGDEARATYSAKFKAMWFDNETTMDLWIYLYVNDADATDAKSSEYDWMNDYFSISVDSDMDGVNAGESDELHSGFRAELWDIAKNNKVTRSGYAYDTTLLGKTTFSLNDKRADDKYYSAEICIPIPKTTVNNNQIEFDILVNDYNKDGTKKYSRIAWNGDMIDTGYVGNGIGTFSNIPTSICDKTHNQKEYTFYKNATAPTEADWNNYKWSENFWKTYSKGSDSSKFSANFKGMYVDNGDNIDLYFYVRVEDATNIDPAGNGWYDDFISISIDANRDGDENEIGELKSDFRAAIEDIVDCKLDNYTKGISFLSVNDKRSDSGYYTVAMCIPIAKTLISNNTFNFDLLANSRGSATEEVYTRIAWNNMNNTSVVGKGIGYLSDEYANHADEPISTEAGAGTRLNDPAGLRFESRINKAKYDALVDAGAEITTGTLIVPTDYLTEYGINNSNFTKANLDVLKVEYLDVVNNGWVNSTSADTDGYYQYYGSIVGIKTANLDRNFSGVGYMTVKTATEEYTVYGGYRAADHARSVQYVAAAAIASGEYNDYLTTLQSFIKDSVPAKADGTTYRIMQYNLLRDNPAEYPEQEWGGSSLEVPNLKSSVRKNITSAAIEGYNPDILVVNERFEDTWSELGLSNKYKVIGETTNRNAIVYNSDVFEEVVKSGSKAFTVSDGVNYRNVSYAILKDGEQLIAVFATHWGTDSANHASQLADMQSCMNEVLTGEYADIPVVIAGDFNSAATATEYSKLITEGGYTNVDAATSVDHIAVKGFEVVGAGRDTKSYTKFASDHKPIYADIKIGG
ncbi:MAG: hypothetical protein IJZ83_04310 [Clostridia bacterium]|nr:hypothetical protein [Clostridia bacterium]